MNALERARRIEFEAYQHMKANPESESAYSAWRVASQQLHHARLQAPVLAAEQSHLWRLAAVFFGGMLLASALILAGRAL